MTIRDLMDRRAKLISDARAMVDTAEKESRDFAADEQKRYDQLLADADQVKGQIDREQRLAAMEADIQREPVHPEERESLPGHEDLEGRSKVFEAFSTPEYRKAFRNYLQNRGKDNMDPELRDVLRKAELQARALQVDIDTKGGVFFGMQNANQIVKGLDNLVFVRQYATTFQIEGASDGLGAPAVENDAADLAWTSEVGAVTEDSTMNFGKRELNPYMLAKLLKVSMKMIRKLPSIESYINERMAYKYAVPQENAFLNGTGAGQPLGAFVANANGVATTRDVNSGHNTQITADGLMDMKYSLKSGYLRNARWTFHRDAVKAIAKLKNGDGQYIWQPALAGSAPDRLLGLPVDISEYAPNTFTQNLYIGLLCDWSYYWIADDLLWSVQVLNELYAGNNQVGFIGRGSTDGMPVVAEAFARMKLSA